MKTRFTETFGVEHPLIQGGMQADERMTQHIFRSFRNTARVARNRISEQVVEIEKGGGQFEDVRELVSGQRGRLVYETGDTDAGIWSAGLSQALIHDVPTVADLVDRIMSEAEEIISGRLAGLLGTPA